MSENTDGQDGLPKATQPAPEPEVRGAREINPFTMDYAKSAYDLRPQPIYDTPVTEQAVDAEPIPKDLSAAEYVSSSAKVVEGIPTESKLIAVHPSQLELPVETVSAEKDSGQPKEPEPLKPPSLPVPKDG